MIANTLVTSILFCSNTGNEAFWTHCRKRRKCWKPAFSPSPTTFSTLPERNFNFSVTSILSSASSFNLTSLKICRLVELKDQDCNNRSKNNLSKSGSIVRCWFYTVIKEWSPLGLDNTTILRCTSLRSSVEAWLMKNLWSESVLQHSSSLNIYHKIIIWKIPERNHVGKYLGHKSKCWLRASSPFPTMFSTLPKDSCIIYAALNFLSANTLNLVK